MPFSRQAHVEDVRHETRRAVHRGSSQVGELDAVVGEDGVDPVGNGCDETSQEVGCGMRVGLLVQLDEGELQVRSMATKR